MAARKKTTRKKKRTFRSTRAAAALGRLEQELPRSLQDYVKRVRSRLTALEKQIDDARRDTRRRWTRLLREASHELGRLEARGERAWRKRTTRARRDAVTLLRRLERAIEPGAGTRSRTPRKKTARKKTARRKTAKKKTA